MTLADLKNKKSEHQYVEQEINTIKRIWKCFINCFETNNQAGDSKWVNETDSGNKLCLKYIEEGKMN